MFYCIDCKSDKQDKDKIKLSPDRDICRECYYEYQNIAIAGTVRRIIEKQLLSWTGK